MKHKMIKTMMTLLIAATAISSSATMQTFAAGNMEETSQMYEPDLENMEEGFEVLFGDNHLAEEDANSILWQQTLLQEKIPSECGHLVYGLSFEEVALYVEKDSETLNLVESGQKLSLGVNLILLDEVNFEENRFMKVATYVEGKPVTGYVERRTVLSKDDNFISWEKENFGDSEEIMLLNDSTQDVWLFPETYRNDLLELKSLHPNWYFMPLFTGLSWNSVLDNELSNDRSWIHKSVPECMKNGRADTSGNWFYPTREALAYYMDPRNYLNENDIFQFELLTFNAQYHTEDAVNQFLNNTFMNSNSYAPGTEITFSLIFAQVGQVLNVSPLHLASRVYQEQGQGTSPLISGVYPGYEGYYNYFNVGASGRSDAEVILNGLKYAKNQGWNDAAKSINGGASLLANSYIAKGQDTLYLQKFNVNPNGYYDVYRHQYMQNIVAAVSEGRKVKQMYAGVDALGSDFVFRIPVYENMPAAVCGNPAEQQTPVNPYPENGWYQENGNFYWYENGVRQGTEGRGKEIFDHATQAWYWLDAIEGGRMATNKDVYQESNGGKWVRYDEFGRMIKGEDFRYGGWYYFEELTGAMVKGWRVDDLGNRYYYDNATGQRVSGYYVADGVERYFDEQTGILAHMRWVINAGKEYWYEDGIRQGYDSSNPKYRGKEIYDPMAGAWFWLDNVQQGAKAKAKEVYQESEAGPYGEKLGSDGKRYGKWVRYDENGFMIKGWYTTSDGRSYYYDLTYGTMVKGWFTLDGDKYYFDSITGVMAKGTVKIGKKTYNFDPATGKLIK